MESTAVLKCLNLLRRHKTRFKGLTLLVDRDGMEIDVRLIVLSVDLLAMHVGNR
jgi:hypothetical protein